MAPLSFDRRQFIAGSGALFMASLTPQAAEALHRTDMLFAATCKLSSGAFAAVLLDEHMNILRQIDLPDRGHDVAFNPTTGASIVFARRPGNFAIAFERASWVKPTTIIAPEGRHFYGHGVFSTDGKLLYATENDFENAEGKIGIYDATDGFNRIGEFSSFGVGPHDLLLAPDGKSLIVANGGIETHPDYGRAKLNLATMKPNLAYIDAVTGDLLERHNLPNSLHQLSIRHIAISPKGRVVFGGQYEGAKSDAPPLIGWSERGEGIGCWESLQQTMCQAENYIGSVAISSDGIAAAVTAPRSNAFALISLKTGAVLRDEKLTGVCGLTAAREGFIASTDQGYIGSLHIGKHQA
ncbi:MAG: DUF1513 domain-containing protein, partial [Hyphomicrobiales bacterium]